MRTAHLTPLLIGAALTLALPSIALATDDGGGTPTESAETVPAEKGTGEKAIACRKSYSAGTGVGRYKWCFSANGTIAQFQGGGVEHLSAASLEGYVLCNGPSLIAANLGATQSGLGPPSFPTANSVVRTTANSPFNQLRIRTTFTNDADSRSANISMEFTNNSGSALSQLAIYRVADFDVDGTSSGDTWYATRTTATAVGSSALSLAGRSADLFTFATATPYGSTARCGWTISPPFQTADNMALVANVMALNPGQTGTAKFAYTFDA